MKILKKMVLACVIVGLSTTPAMAGGNNWVVPAFAGAVVGAAIFGASQSDTTVVTGYSSYGYDPYGYNPHYYGGFYNSPYYYGGPYTHYTVVERRAPSYKRYVPIIDEEAAIYEERMVFSSACSCYKKALVRVN